MAFLLTSGFWLLTSSAQTPRDMATSHWAARAVKETLRNGVLTLDKRGAFHGAAKVTQIEAATALAKLAQRLEARAWRGEKSLPLPAPSRLRAAEGWERRAVTRCELASVLARLGDYAANGIHPAAKNSADAGRSIVLPKPPNVALPRRHPAYAAISYLLRRRMIAADSPLLNPTTAPITASQLQTALAQMLIGLNDRLTDLGHDKNGGTPDRSFHK